MASLFMIDQPNERLNFQKEISSIMHACGDNPNPNPATVILVENIVYQQLRSILHEARLRSQKRGVHAKISPGDIIFLYRNKIGKLRRMYKYFCDFELLCKKTKHIETDMFPNNLASEDVDKTKITREIKSYDEFGELDEPHEDIMMYLRKVRAARMSETLSLEKYEAYHAARCVSFRSGVNNFSKLATWINPNEEFPIVKGAVHILSYMAFETVAEIVDFVYLIRQDNKKKNSDPFSQFSGGYYCNPMSLGNGVYIKSGYEGAQQITVAEVREVIRRFCNGTTTAGSGLFFRNIPNDMKMKHLCL